MHCTEDCNFIFIHKSIPWWWIDQRASNVSRHALYWTCSWIDYIQRCHSETVMWLSPRLVSTTMVSVNKGRFLPLCLVFTSCSEEITFKPTNKSPVFSEALRTRRRSWLPIRHRPVTEHTSRLLVPYLTSYLSKRWHSPLKKTLKISLQDVFALATLVHFTDELPSEHMKTLRGMSTSLIGFLSAWTDRCHSSMLFQLSLDSFSFIPCTDFHQNVVIPHLGHSDISVLSGFDSYLRISKTMAKQRTDISIHK